MKMGSPKSFLWSNNKILIKKSTMISTEYVSNELELMTDMHTAANENLYFFRNLHDKLDRVPPQT